MILVISYSGDVGTTPILNWLASSGRQYKRINLAEEDFSKLTISITNKDTHLICLELSDGSILNFNEVSIILYRGGAFIFDENKLIKKNEKV